MPLVQRVYRKPCTAAGRLRRGVKRTNKVAGSHLGQVQLTSDLLLGFSFDQGSAENQNKGAASLKLLVPEVSDEMRLTDATGARNNQFALVQEPPGNARKLLADMVHSRAEYG